MKSLLSLGALVMMTVGVSAASASKFRLFLPTWGDVIVATDTTVAGREIEPPDPGRPIYYRGLSLGAKLGWMPGHRLPDDKEMGRAVAEVLAKQGYRAATAEGQSPELFLVMQWGLLRPLSGQLPWFLGYNSVQDIGAPSMAGLLGPEVWRRNFRSRTTSTILEYAGTDIYGIIITAFDYETADTPEPVVYWQTRIALPANGKSMDEALPAMVLAAGPAIGRNSGSPLLLSIEDAREGRVEMGDAEVQGIVDDDVRSDPVSRKGK